jgi:solute carrier family 25 (mitochondrial citrate transporter), member 1
MVKEEGIKGIYKGILPTMLKQGGNQAARFTIYNNIKDYLLSKKPKENKTMNGVESFFAGII